MREDFLSSFSFLFLFVSVKGNTLIYFILTLSSLTSLYYYLFIVLVAFKHFFRCLQNRLPLRSMFPDMNLCQDIITLILSIFVVFFI